MSYTKNIYHFIFGTHRRERTITPDSENKLYAYITGIVKSKGGVVYAINGMPDHVHLLCDVPPTISISDFVKSLKQSSSKWMKECGYFPRWKGWSAGYAEFTCSFYTMHRVVDYINNLKRHHTKTTFDAKIRNIFSQIGKEYDNRYVFQ